MRQPCRREDTAQGTSPDGAYWWLHAKSLDAAIGCVLAQYWPSGRHGHHHRRRVQNTNKTQLLASNYDTFLLAELSIFIRDICQYTSVYSVILLSCSHSFYHFYCTHIMLSLSIFWLLCVYLNLVSLSDAGKKITCMLPP